MTRRLTVILMCMLLLWVAVGMEAAENEAPDLRGFAGYAYDSGINSIASDMEVEGYTLFGRGDNDLWYESQFVGIDCELGYIFNRGALIGGAMILSNISMESFASVNNYLRRTYDEPINITIDGKTAIAVMWGPDSKITHILDMAKMVHVVEYTREKIEETP